MRRTLDRDRVGALRGLSHATCLLACPGARCILHFMRNATIEPETIESPRWQAVGLVLDQNARDLRAGRYGRMQEVVSWFKGIDLFRQAEFERMIERKPTPLDKRYHKTWLAALIAEGERLSNEVRRAGGLPRNPAGIKLSDIEANVEELCDTQAEWHGGFGTARRRELFKELFEITAEAYQEFKLARRKAERAQLSRLR